LKNIILFFVLFFIVKSGLTQEIAVKKDSTRLYKNIESFSERNKITKFMYGLAFNPIAPDSIKKINRNQVQNPYRNFEGKIIRNINIETLNPFGNSINDTNEVSKNFIAKVGNTLHIKTQSSTIRNLLLIHQNQLFDSLLVKESERLIRRSGFVQDVAFFVSSSSKNSDSVDIYIRELDNWSIIPNGSYSPSGISIRLTEKNFLGFGHTFENSYTSYNATNNFGYYSNYYIPNIRNTYINSNIRYSIGQYNNSVKSFAVDRPFFSPFAKWAAGISVSQIGKDSTYSNNLLFVQQHVKYNVQDYWAGYSFQLFKGNSEYVRTTNFISAFRFLRIRYLEKPIELFDPQHFYANEDFYLASFGISTRKYAKDKYIFNFGITEDVPKGKVYSFTAGYQNKDNIYRLYLGARISSGNYYPWGYLSFNFEYGTFIRSSHFEQGVISAGANYFTDIFEIGKWKFRQFVKPQLIIGINSFATDSLTLNDGYGLDGFNSILLSGSSRLLFTLQTQSYAPWNFIGFHFGPYFTWTLGMLGNAEKGFSNSKVYSQIGLGVLIKNLNLVINTFQISIAFYPSIPGIGQNIFKLNSFKTTDFGFRDFEIGKPNTVRYR